MGRYRPILAPPGEAPWPVWPVRRSLNSKDAMRVNSNNSGRNGRDKERAVCMKYVYAVLEKVRFTYEIGAKSDAHLFAYGGSSDVVRVYVKV